MNPDGNLRDVPDFLDATQQGCWREIVADMPAGALKNADNFAVEALSRLMAKVRTNNDTPAVYAQLGAYLDRFGMNPKSRPNVQLPTAPVKNSFADI
ncbi:MAG TPA: hypothetical protein VL069_03780 [Opitutus sp.]|nr:hypothetical protein [Opitutus sp.]